MKSLKHFSYAFLHLFTFVIMMYLFNNMDAFTRHINESGLWFISLIILVNAGMGGAHLMLFFKSLNVLADMPMDDLDYDKL